MKNSNSIIKGMLITEKGTRLTEKSNQYLFRVDPKAGKTEIKKAVENLFGVKVERVNTMRYEGKRKRERTVKYGKKSDWKRAVVKLSEGSKIDLT